MFLLNVGVRFGSCLIVGPLSLRDFGPAFGVPTVPTSLWWHLDQRRGWRSAAAGRCRAPALRARSCRPPGRRVWMHTPGRSGRANAAILRGRETKINKPSATVVCCRQADKNNSRGEHSYRCRTSALSADLSTLMRKFMRASQVVARIACASSRCAHCARCRNAVVW
jgi:hypothetical protein